MGTLDACRESWARVMYCFVRFVKVLRCITPDFLVLYPLSIWSLTNDHPLKAYKKTYEKLEQVQAKG